MRFILSLSFILSFLAVWSQKQTPFSGELTYTIERVDQPDSSRSKMLIYAKDSLLKVVNFNSLSGKQELIKHLTYNKSYLLIETPLQNFAVRTNEHLEKDSVKQYTFHKKFGSKKIGGLKGKRYLVKLRGVKNELTYFIHPKISWKYANNIELPGLPLLFYVSTENGLYKYTLESYKISNPPLEIFMIPKDFKKVTFDEFAEEFSKLYEGE